MGPIPPNTANGHAQAEPNAISSHGQGHGSSQTSQDRKAESGPSSETGTKPKKYPLTSAQRERKRARDREAQRVKREEVAARLENVLKVIDQSHTIGSDGEINRMRELLIQLTGNESRVKSPIVREV